MRRLAVGLVVAAALAAGCGGGEEGDSVPADATTGPTEAQLAAREKLVAQIEAGTYRCYCTAALRARERIGKGLANAPSRGG
jgi:hypothetical protein